MDNFYLKVIDSFNLSNVDYLVIGGFAVNYYGYNRSTGDLDLWLTNSNQNLDALQKALNSLGYEFEDDAKSELKQNRIISFTEDGCTVELITKINISQDVRFEDALIRCEEREVEGVTIKVIGFDDLKNEKAKSGRYKDLDDLSKLEEAQAFYERLKKE